MNRLIDIRSSVSIARREFLKLLAALGSIAAMPSLAQRSRAQAQRNSSPTVFLVKNGDCFQNIDKLFELLGGASRYIEPSDVVIIKGNAQWPYQGYTHTGCIKAVIDSILAIPGFSGEVIVCDNVQIYGNAGQFGFDTPPEYRTRNWPNHNWDSLAADYQNQRKAVATKRWATSNSEISSPADGEGWIRDFFNFHGVNTYLSYPVFESPLTPGRMIDMKNGVWENGSYTGRHVKTIVMPTLNNHGWNSSDYAGITGAIKAFFGMTEIHNGAGGNFKGYRNIHSGSYGRGNAGYAGELVARYINTNYAPVLYITAAMWSGHHSRTGPATETKTVLACEDPATLDFIACRDVISPHAPYLDPTQNNETKNTLVGCVNAGVGSMDTNRINLITYDFQTDSASSHLVSPVYSLWNGFLGMTNILELTNIGASELSLTIALYSINGTLVHRQSASLSAYQQRDSILNSMPGFKRDSYGIIEISFEGSIDGRLVCYRQTSASDFNFVSALPLSNTHTDTRLVCFNTFQPSFNPSEQDSAVLNWLSIVNLESDEKSFLTTKYDQSGTLLSETNVSIAPFSRVDLDGGHDNPGPSTVGLLEITPDDAQTRYLSHLVRYGSNTPLTALPTRYDFSFSLEAGLGSSSTTYLPVSRRLTGDNWLEIANVLDESVQVQVVIYSGAGASIFDDTLTLPAHAQQHIHAASFLSDDDLGYAAITPSKPAAVIAQSMSYFRNPNTGFISALYGVQNSQPSGRTLKGSYNLYLGMQNWLRISNTSATSLGLSFRLGISAQTYDFTLHERASIEFALHDTSTYGTSADSYGVFLIESDSTDCLFSHLVRTRTLSDNSLDFAASTWVR